MQQETVPARGPAIPQPNLNLIPDESLSTARANDVTLKKPAQ